MPRFFVDQPLIAGTELSLPDAVVRHVQVLRLNAGDALTVFNGSPPDLEYPARILAVGKREVRVQLDAALAVSRESPLRLGLAQGISSGERMDFTLQKGVEMGVNVFQPLATQRSIVRLSGERADKRLARWRDIILSACEQCGRNTVPELRLHPQPGRLVGRIGQFAGGAADAVAAGQRPPGRVARPHGGLAAGRPGRRAE